MTNTEQQNIKFTCRLGRPLSYVSAGEGPALVIVNAYGVMTALWDQVIDRLANRYRVIIWNMRGFSPDEFDLKFKLDDHVEDMIEIVKHANAQDAHILGYCSGTKVALGGFMKLKETVRSLVFVGGNFWPMADYGAMNCRFATNLLSMAKLIEKRAYLAPVVVTMMTGKGSSLPMVAENLALIPEAYRDLVVAPFATKGAVINYARLVTNYYSIDATPYLAAINVPTFVIGAERDVIVDAALSPAAAKRIKNAEFLSIPEFNHFPMVEDPERLSTLVGNFLGQQSARSDAPMKGAAIG